MITRNVTQLRDQVLTALLPNVPSHGWTWDGVWQAAEDEKLVDGTVEKIFPNGLIDVVSHFSDWADREMLSKLESVDAGNLRVRDRIALAVKTRFEVLNPHKDAMRLALAYWSVPPRNLTASRIIWRTADRIWNWAGDTATDYNRTTKRALLAGILTATALVWMKDTTSDQEITKSFLDRRIENVLQFGQMLGRFKR